MKKFRDMIQVSHDESMSLRKENISLRQDALSAQKTIYSFYDEVAALTIRLEEMEKEKAALKEKLEATQLELKNKTT